MINFFRSLLKKSSASIGDPIQVKTLMEKMEAHLPIRAHATKELLHTMNTSKPGVQIVKVMYMGNEGVITCLLEAPGKTTSALVVSLTHLRLANTHPLVKDVRAYQTVRTQKLAAYH